MFTNNSTQQDAESAAHHEQQQEQPSRSSELDPLIQRGDDDEKGPTEKEARTAHAQFLALCLVMFVIGWTDGSTGPLLPRIQSVYDVSFFLRHLLLLSTSHQFLQIGFGTVSWVFVSQCSVSHHYSRVVGDGLTLYLSFFFPQGVVVGALLNMPLSDRLGLGNVRFSNLEEESS